MRKSAYLLGLFLIITIWVGCNSHEEDMNLKPTKGQAARESGVGDFIADLPGNEIAFFQDYNYTSDKFPVYYVFQYESNKELFDVSQLEDVKFVEFDGITLKIKVDDSDIYTFTTDDNYNSSNSETIFTGYGLSKHEAGEGIFLIKYTGVEITDFADAVEWLNDGSSSSTSGVNCDHGGVGASSCSATGSAGGSCSVTCNQGYYACCNELRLKCRCKKNGATGTPGKVIKTMTKPKPN